MTQNGFIGKLTTLLQWDEQQTSEVLKTITDIFVEHLSENRPIEIENFGTFYIQKYEEYILHDSESGERYLMPPEVVVLFEPYMDEELSDITDQKIQLSFDADDSLKRDVNSAFQNFEPTLINEGVDFPGIQVVATEQPEPEVVEADVESEPATERDYKFKSIPKAEQGQVRKSRSRKRSAVLIPILGGIAIVMATLFFFNGTEREKKRNSRNNRNNRKL